MKFINKGKKSVEVRIGKRFNYSWITVKNGEIIDLSEDKGKRYGFECYKKLQKVTEGKIGKKKVETKQFKKEDGTEFYNELIKIKGIGYKTAEDILEIFTKEELIKTIIKKEHLPFRDDIEIKLRRKYG